MLAVNFTAFRLLIKRHDCCPGIMTGKLLPAFLACFDDENMSIRSECCITCGNILIREKEILSKLLHLATNDPIWKVKALAIQGISDMIYDSDCLFE